MTAIDEIDFAGLFDPAFYMSAYSDVVSANASPIEHYCEFGWREERQPNPWFDTRWYLETSPDVRRADSDPLLHYIRHGEAEGRRPAPHFDPLWYAKVNAIEGPGALFHFLRHRLNAGVCPVPELYAVPHLPAYRDDRAVGIDPFLRFLSDRQACGAPLLPDIDVIARSAIFDPNHYLINGADVHRLALDPIEHFCRHGWREGRKPCVYFDPDWYRFVHAAVGLLKVNPLAHYILEGEAAGLRPVVFFDPAWYQATYGLASHESPLAHYLANRRTQQFSPNAHFDVAWYVERTRLGPNRDPFAHFLRAGMAADVDPSPAFDAARYRKAVLGRPSRHFRGLQHPSRDNPLVHWLAATYPPRSRWLRQAAADPATPA